VTVLSVPRPVALAAVAALAAGALLIGPAAPALADPVALQPGELVVNGGAEQGTVGWTGSLTWYTHGSGGYPQSVIVDENGLTGATFDGGTRLFTGTGGSSTASQTIDLSPSAAAIDNGHVTALTSAYVGGYTTQRDNATVSYEFFDASDSPVASAVFGPVMPADRGNIAGFVPFAQAVPLPVGTRSAVITITTQRFVAPANDGYVDNVSLVLDAPSPIATPNEATTDEGVPVTLSPAADDTPGAGAAIVPGSVRLLVDGAAVTNASTPEGDYAVDTATGEVLFTPAPGFTGDTTPLPYVVTDSSGQSAQSTITVHVLLVAAPALAVTKSASPSDPASFVVGQHITYSFLVENTGNVPVSGVSVTETIFTGTGTAPAPTCPPTVLAPGEQLVCVAEYTLTQDDVDSHVVANVAIANGTPSAGILPPSAPSTVLVPVDPAPAVELVKTATPTAASVAGDVISYSYLVRNTGNVTLPSVAIEETTFTGSGAAPAPTCPPGALLPGQTVTCTASYTLTQADADAGSVRNEAVATATVAGIDASSDPSGATVTIAPRPGITVAKTASATTITAAGQSLVYTIRITNGGNVTLDALAVNDYDFTGEGALGALDCPAAAPLAPGAHVDCEVGYRTVAADLGNEIVSNTATASARTPGGATVGSDPSVITIPVEPGAPTDPPSTEGDDPALIATGSAVTGPAALAASLLLLGAGLVGAALLARRRRV